VTPSSPGPRRASRQRTDSPMIPLCISVDPEMKEKLEQIADAEERSLSFIFREALKRYFEHRRKAA